MQHPIYSPPRFQGWLRLLLCPLFLRTLAEWESVEFGKLHFEDSILSFQFLQQNLICSHVVSCASSTFCGVRYIFNCTQKLYTDINLALLPVLVGRNNNQKLIYWRILLFSTYNSNSLTTRIRLQFEYAYNSNTLTTRISCNSNTTWKTLAHNYTHRSATLGDE